MFGIFRYVLAHMVVIAHLWPALTDWTGIYAVFSFYTLSGYLMTHVLTTVYGFSYKGMSRFLLNRALRIFPPYWFVLAFSIILILLIPDIEKGINSRLNLPSSMLEWVHNVFIFGLYSDQTRLVPPAWSLNVELFFYVLMAVFLVRKRSFVILWFSVSLLYTVYMLGAGFDFAHRYYPPQAASLPFSLGALIFSFRKELGKMPKWTILPATILFLINAFFSKAIWGNERCMGFYLSVFAGAYLLVCLQGIDDERLPSVIRKIDKALGDLSYPVFLCHWQVASIVVWVGFSGVKPWGQWLLLSSVVFINLVAYLLNVAVDHPLRVTRSQVRKGCISNSKSMYRVPVIR